MKFGYMEFVEELRLILADGIGISRERIRFEEKGGPHAGKEDQLFVECGEGERKGECGFYTESLYHRYRNDVSLEEIAGTLIEHVRRLGSTSFMEVVDRLADYEEARKFLFIRLLNYEKNRETLKKAVYCLQGDIALVLYLKVHEDGEMVNSTKVLKQYVAGWEKSEGEVFEEAFYNTYRMAPPRIYMWKKLLCDPEYQGEEFMEQEMDIEDREDVRGNCLSTTRKTNGAVAIFLPGVAKRLSDMMESDLYLAFTSIHEVMVHNADKVSMECLKEVLEETIQEATPEADFLSYKIYHYSREEKCFTWM